jgi:tRNA (adenine37-N6)-methyltransferase
MGDIIFRAIGTIHSEFKKQEGTPIQPAFAGEAKGWIELDPAYVPALKDLTELERIWVIYQLDRAPAFKPLVVPYLDTTERGLFATRSPCRPNPIGISVLRLVSIAGARIDVLGVDILDGTPLLDIKPYVPAFDAYTSSQAGWFDRVAPHDGRADSRFG